MRSNYRSIEIVNGPGFATTIGWVVLALFVQSVLAPFITIRGAVPSLVMIPVVLFALRRGARNGAIVGVVAGALGDVLAGTGGAWTIADTVIALAAGGIARGFFSDGFLMPSALVGAAVIVRDGIFWALESLEGYPPGYGEAHLHATLWQGLLTAIVALAAMVVRSRFFPDTTRIERLP